MVAVMLPRGMKRRTVNMKLMKRRQKGRGEGERLQQRVALETCEGQQKVTQIGEAQNRTIDVGQVRNDCETDRDQKKRKYSREEMEALRFANIAEQRKLWRDIYTGLGDDAVKGYKDLASSKHHKNASLNFNPWKHFGRKEPGIP
ncbi:hypothetical protein OIU78_025705, partial [Salix suchowensis]